MFSFIFILMSTFTSHADSIEQMDFDVVINENGDANITEKWVTTFDEGDSGTERYRTFYDLDNEITGITVSQNGKPLEKDPEEWDIDRNFEEKANTFGVRQTNQGFELSWGIGSYGPSTYEVNYTVKSFVRNLKDSDMAFWSFISPEFSPKPKKVTTRIHYSDKTKKEVQMWAFGFKGEINPTENGVFQESTGNVNSVRILLKYPEKTFNSEIKENKKFSYYEKKAKKGSDYESDNFPFFSLFATFAPFLVIGLAVRFNVLGIYHHNIKNIPEMRKRIKKVRKDDFRSSLPYEGNPDDIILTLSFDSDYRDKILTILLSRLVLKGFLEVQGEKEYIIIDKEKERIDLSTTEKELLDIIEYAFRSNPNPRIKDLEKALSKSNFYNDIEELIEKVEDESEVFMIYNNLLEEQKKGFLFTENGLMLGEELIKFKNYLESFTLMEERKLPEIHLWEKWLEYAYLFDIPEVVIEAIQRQQPNDSRIRRNTFRSISSFSTASSRGMEKARRSSGGGGHSSSGGGSGSSGGGGGGTR